MLSFQMHPEFEHDFGSALLATRSDRIPEALSVPGQESYKGGSDRLVLGQWIAEFFMEHKA